MEKRKAIRSSDKTSAVRIKLVQDRLKNIGVGAYLSPIF